MHKALKSLQSEDGVSLVELIVTLFLLGVVSTIFSSVLGSSLDATRDMEGSTRANDEIRLSMQAIGRELRAAATICSPRPGTPSDVLWFFVEDGSGVTATVEEYVYKVVDFDGDGEVDDLVKSEDSGTTYWRVADGVVNAVIAAELAVPQPLFTNQGQSALNSGSTLAATPSYGKVVSVEVWIDTSPNDNISPRLESTEVAGRNIWTPNAATCPIAIP